VNDAWIAKFDSTGAPLFSSFYGGAMDEKTWGMQLRGAYLYVAGSSQSTDLMMNVTSPQDSMWGGLDGWILKMDTSGNYITSTYLGGSGSDEIYALTVNQDTMVTCVGATYSNNLPVTPGAYQSTYMILGDGLVARYKLSEELFSSSIAPNSSNVISTIHVFPNPAQGGSFTIVSEFEMQNYSIQDMEGRVVQESRVTPANRLLIDNDYLSDGLYILRIEGVNGQTECQQLIVR
jgi:hypothetical protein